MNMQFYDKPARVIPFRLRGYDGTVAVYYGQIDNPESIGFDSLPGLNFDIDLCQGYPMIHARIDNYKGSGYLAYCGWIQIVTSEYQDTHDTEKAQIKKIVAADVNPAYSDYDIPFALYGSLPQLFDAPCQNPGNSAELRWTADTFLTTAPMRSRNEQIAWLMGFRWGYIENDKPDHKPVLLPLEVTDEHVWNSYHSYLSENYPNWRFKKV